MKKTIVAASVAAVLATTGVAGVGLAQAATERGGSDHSGLVSAIAKKFKLKESDVQAVFDENHTARQAEREADIKHEVAQLVKDGKLTQAQADLINAKRTELQKTRNANRGNMSSKTDTERKAAMDAERTALDKWFTDNSIPTDYRYLVFGGRHGGPGGHHDGPRDGKRGMMDNSSSINNQ